MSDFKQGHVKRNPDNGSIAVRTHFPDNTDFTNITWLVSSIVHGPSHAPTSSVESWDDIYIPE